LRTIYAHLSEVVVKAGDKVSRGQMIARVGRTGRVPKDIQTDHLHFEVREATNPINPMKLLPEVK
jgi:murein DD-endopeptidase MepM/ murein hydrolase activator NlpD